MIRKPQQYSVRLLACALCGLCHNICVYRLPAVSKFEIRIFQSILHPARLFYAWLPASILISNIKYSLSTGVVPEQAIKGAAVEAADVHGSRTILRLIAENEGVPHEPFPRGVGRGPSGVPLLRDCRWKVRIWLRAPVPPWRSVLPSAAQYAVQPARLVYVNTISDVPHGWGSCWKKYKVLLHVKRQVF